MLEFEGGVPIKNLDEQRFDKDLDDIVTGNEENEDGDPFMKHDFFGENELTMRYWSRQLKKYM